MAFNVNTFRGELAQGGARPSLFEIQLFQPTGGTLNGGDLTLSLPSWYEQDKFHSQHLVL